jgi:DNA-nicking Smr family endonuclease
MALLVAGVAPLDGVERVTRPAKRSMPSHVVAPKEGSDVEFVLRREAGGVQAYRADLPARTVVPGQAEGWNPEVELDLHGLRARQVGARIALTIGECRRRRRTRVLVIHGKGLHSVRGESVLAEAAIESLTSGPYARYVLAFSTAPDRLGGAGALVVDLESSRS